MVLENLVKGVKYVAGGLALGASMLFGGAVMSGCDEINNNAEESREVIAFNAIGGEKEVELSWEYPNNIEQPGVMIRRDVESPPISPSDGILVYEGPNRSYLDTGLTENILYCYTAFVFSYTDPQVFSLGKTASVVAQPLEYQKNLEFRLRCEHGKIILTWRYPAYESEFNGVLINKWNAIDHQISNIVFIHGPNFVWGEEDSFEDLDICGNVLYYYSIEKWCSDGLVNYTKVGPTLCGTTTEDNPPSEVFNFWAVAVDKTITLNWTNPTIIDFDKVTVRRKSDSFPTNKSDGELVYEGKAESCSDTFTDEDVAIERLYYYRIFTQDISNNVSNGSSLFKTLDHVLAAGWIGGGIPSWKTSDGTNSGTDYQSFYGPIGICVSSDGEFIFIAERDSHRISKWDKDGYAQGWIGGGSDGWKTGSGAGNGYDYKSFTFPMDVSLDSNGNIYVVEEIGRVSKWDSNGNAIGWIGANTDGWQTVDFGMTGNLLRTFSMPRGLHLDSNGDIYVADTNNNRIVKWNANGSVQGWLGRTSGGWQTSDGPGMFNSPQGVFVDDNGNIYVADTGNHCVWEWDSNANPIGWIGGGSNGWQTGSAPNPGADYQSFNMPIGIFVSSDGNMYITEMNNERVSKWDSHGVAIGWIGNGQDGWQIGDGASSGNNYRTFMMPHKTFVFNDGRMYIADYANHRICRWID